MPTCVVKSCKNYTKKHKKLQGVTYHAFPREKNRRDDWLRIIRNCRDEYKWNPSRASTVCSAHFDDVDFITTAKGLRCLVPDAIPKKLLSDLPETQTQSTSSPILQAPVVKDEFVLTGYCRLCAASISDDKLINVQSDDVLKKLVVNMLHRLDTKIDFSLEKLPTTVCSVCVKSLYTAYDFVVGIDLAQVTVYKILMQKYQMPENFNLGNNTDLASTSLQQTNNGPEPDFEQPKLHAPSTIKSQVSPNIEKVESNSEQPLLFRSNMTTPVPPASPKIEVVANDLDQPDQPWLHVSSTITPLQQLSPTAGPAISNFEQPTSLQLSPTIAKYSSTLNTIQIFDLQKKDIRRLNQKVKRLENRNESLKIFMKNFKEKNFLSTLLYQTLNENTVATDLFNNLNRIKMKKHKTYTQATKKFCQTLNGYSPRAYDYLRQSFDCCLPHQITLAKWEGYIKSENRVTKESSSIYCNSSMT